MLNIGKDITHEAKEIFLLLDQINDLKLKFWIFTMVLNEKLEDHRLRIDPEFLKLTTIHVSQHNYPLETVNMCSLVMLWHFTQLIVCYFRDRVASGTKRAATAEWSGEENIFWNLNIFTSVSRVYFKLVSVRKVERPRMACCTRIDPELLKHMEIHSLAVELLCCLGLLVKPS